MITMTPHKHGDCELCILLERCQWLQAFTEVECELSDEAAGIGEPHMEKDNWLDKTHEPITVLPYNWAA